MKLSQWQLGSLLAAAVLPLLQRTAATSVPAQQQHGRSRQVVTPIQKAIELLQGMLAKAESGKHVEQLQYAGFTQFCSDVTLDKQRAIVKGDEQISTLQALIFKYNVDIDRLSSAVLNQNAAISGWTNDTQAAGVVRESELADYGAMRRNYSESIAALTQAIVTLKKQAYDRPGSFAGSAALVQAMASVGRLSLPGGAGRAVQAFLERSSEDPDLTFVANPPTVGYKFRSYDLISMLEGLAAKFKDMLTALDREEVTRRQAYATVVQDLKHSMDAAQDDVAEKTKSELSDRQMLVQASADLQQAQSARKADAEYLAGLTATCTSKASDYQGRQQLRKEEIDALSQAVQILGSSAVSGAAEAHLPQAAALAQRGAVLVRLRAASAGRGGPQGVEAVAATMAFLRSTSRRLGSHALSALAMRAQEDPFAKVKTLIEELLKRLLAEEGKEAEQKGWCDTELATNAHTRKAKSQSVELLTSEIDALQASIASLAKDLQELSVAVAQIEADVARETDLRNAEKVQNNQTAYAARQAQAALAAAISTLRDFYAKASRATVFVQSRELGKRQPTPAIFDDTPYQGLQSEQGGVLGMLEVIQSDFARLESDTARSESTSQQEYDQFMEASSIDNVQKQKDIEYKTSSKQAQEAAVSNKQSDLDSASRELALAQQAYEQLRPTCLDTGMSYEERKGRREDEIEALKEALRILSGEAEVMR